MTSLKGAPFSEVCETLVVNAHGCALLTRVKLDAGIPLHLHSKDGREAMARVVSCQPTGPDHRSWTLGAKLDRPENFWGLRECPKDWALPLAVVPPPLPQSAKSAGAVVLRQLPSRAARTLEAVPDRGMSAAQVQKLIAEAMRPLQAEVRALKEQLAQRQTNPSRFEVSLASIPPELEQQIEVRLRTDVGPRVTEEARRQSVQLLATAKAALDQQARESYENFLRGVAQELKAVEKRAQDISQRISEEAQQQLRAGVEDFRQKLLTAGHTLKRLGGELLQFLEQNLNAEYQTRSDELEQLRAAAVSESSRLQEQIEYLDTRIARLSESANSLESGLDVRLSRMSSDTVKETRAQFEKVADEIFEDLTARSVRALADQFDETSRKMKLVEDDTVGSASESLRIRAANVLQAFERSLDELATASTERCRAKLEAGLHALAQTLNEHLSMARPRSDSE